MPGLKNKKPPLKKKLKKGAGGNTARHSSSTAKKSVKPVAKKAVKKLTVKKDAVKKSVTKTTTTTKTASKKSVSKTVSKTPIKKVVKKSVLKSAAVATGSKVSTIKHPASTSSVKPVKKIVKKDDTLTKKSVQKSSKKTQTVLETSNKRSLSTAPKNNSKIAKNTLAKSKKTGIIGAPSTMNNKKVVTNVQSNKNEKIEKETSSTVVQSHVAPITNFASAVDLTTEIVDPGFLDNGDVFDEADHAQWQQLREQADIHSRAMQLNKPESHPDFNGFECVECGEEIPLPRLKMHKVRCVDCQNDLEKDRQRVQRSTYQPKGGTSSGWDE